MYRMFEKYGIDIRKEPILVYPTLHYQNGGIDINDTCETTKVENLFVAGEAVGGIHGRNRLMGNSLLDVIVFGRDAGLSAAEKSKTVKTGKLTLKHVDNFEKELEKAGISGAKAEISGKTDDGETEIVQVKINLTDSVIDEKLGHINMNELAVTTTCKYLGIDKSKVVAYG